MWKKRGYHKTMRCLGELGAKLDAPNYVGATPCFVAAQNGNLKASEMAAR